LNFAPTWDRMMPCRVTHFACLLAATSLWPASALALGPGTIGLVVTDIRYALYETPEGKEECPDGLQVGEVVQFKSMPDHLEHMAKYGGTTANRGKNGELANFVPLAIEEPIPFRELKTTIGYGFNLDGTQDGRATARSLAHEKFTDPSGAKVDNQIARVLGCVMGWRSTGFMAEFYSDEVMTSPHNRFLIEIRGVDDERNDPAVEVRFYKGIDRLLMTPEGKGFIPFLSHRIDHRATQYMFKANGRIVDGELITEPMPDFRMTLVQVQMLGERVMRSARFRLKLDENGAAGLMGGYEPIDTWWNIFSKCPGSDPGRYSAPLVYRALLRYADGYPDPKTGEATAISVAYRVSAVRALIVHENAGKTQFASAEQ
jgi:hypothetical protein